MRRVLFVLPIVLSACSLSPSADVIKALAGDPNTVYWQVTTPWGGSIFCRNQNCGGATSPSPVVVVSPNVAPSHVEIIRP